jgi:hypothetical protein
VKYNPANLHRLSELRSECFRTDLKVGDVVSFANPRDGEIYIGVVKARGELSDAGVVMRCVQFYGVGLCTVVERDLKKLPPGANVFPEHAHC